LVTRAPGLLLSVDLGTTVLKVAVFDARTGVALGSATRRLPVALTPDGGREQTLGDVDHAVDRAIRGLRIAMGGAWRGVEGIGLAAQGGSTIVAEAGSGRALTPMVLWNDGRAYPKLGAIAARKTASFWRKVALRDGPGMGLARVEWLREREPDLLCDGRMLVGAGEYLFHRLTGVWRQDTGNAHQQGGYDAAGDRLDARLLGLVGLPLSFVAPLRRGHESHPLSATAAVRYGLAAGIPVAGPYIDQEAAYMASVGGDLSRPLMLSLGTAWVGNFQLPAGRDGYSSFQLVLPSPVGSGSLIVQPLLTGNIAWDWALATFLQGSPRTRLARQDVIFAERMFPPRGLVALPWLNRPNPLDPGALGAGAFVGAAPGTTPADMMRAVAVGMACETGRVFEAVRAEGLVDGVVLAGGAARGAHFRQLLAAAFAPLPVFSLPGEDLAMARGALYGLAPHVAKEPMRPEAAAPEPEFREHMALYRIAFDRLLSHEPAGGAYIVRKRNRDQ
jgi:sugar (pentulose or hexulose) kinase